QNPMAFCMLLRKHFQGGRITAIRQVDSERIVEILIDHINEMGFSVPKKLIVEIMGKHSNIIALDDSNIILDCIKRISLDRNRYRQLLPGLPYISPPDQSKVNFYTITEDQLILILKKGGAALSLSEKLVNGISGISPTISEEICAQAGNGEIYPILAKFTHAIETGNLTPVVYIDRDQKPMDFHVFSLSALEGYYEKIVLEGAGQAADYYYTHRDSSNRIRQKSTDLKKIIHNNLNRQYLKKQRLSEDLLKAKNADFYRIQGELLTAHLHEITNGMEKVSVINYYNNQMVEISMDPRLSPGKNAQKYFKKYGKAKTAIKEKNTQLKEVNESITYLESILTFTDNAETIEEIEEIRQELVEGGYLQRRKSSYRLPKSKFQPLAYHTDDGFQILVGRNNKENDKLTFRIANKKDLWFHTKDIPGSHVILRTDGKPVSETSILDAASLSAYYSKARSSENVPVDYTQVRNVKKPAAAKPGMVIFTDNHTLYVTPKSPD
ncbi:MAG: NFACT RNA binding domain-containing protein, partial [Eubacteriales bacterium]|nr:NFACT RNA binding domain-containing protein [Eubacteriales bacterium]